MSSVTPQGSPSDSKIDIFKSKDSKRDNVLGNSIPGSRPTDYDPEIKFSERNIQEKRHNILSSTTKANKIGNPGSKGGKMFSIDFSWLRGNISQTWRTFVSNIQKMKQVIIESFSKTSKNNSISVNVEKPGDRAQTLNQQMTNFLKVFVDQPKFYKEQGIFRLAGLASNNKEIDAFFRSSKPNFENFYTKLNGNEISFHDIASGFKRFIKEINIFRKEPEKFDDPNLVEDFCSIQIPQNQDPDAKDSTILALQTVIRRLDPDKREFFKLLTAILNDTSKNSKENMMVPYNLAVTVAPNLSENFDVGKIANATKVLQFIIENQKEIFAEEIFPP